MRGRREWCRWAVEGWWKTALCGTTAYQAADPIVGSISGLERPAVSATDTGVGFIGQLNGTLIYRLTEHWGLRAGYNFYWRAGPGPIRFRHGGWCGHRHQRQRRALPPRCQSGHGVPLVTLGRDLSALLVATSF
jgi:hypothetical protein